MPSSIICSLSFSVLLLVFASLPIVSAVCRSCWGKAEGCGDSGFDNCPWQKQNTSNATAVLASSSAVIVLGSVLRPKFLRLFPPRILTIIKSLITKPKSGQPLDLTGKGLVAISDAIKAGHVSKDEAVIHLLGRLDAVPATDTDALEQKKDIRKDISIIQQLSGSSTSAATTTDGPLLFILSKLSAVTCTKSSLTFELCMEVDLADSKAGTSSSSSSSGKVTLVRPKSFEQMASLLHHFQLLVVTVGFCHISVVSSFLDEVVLEPVREGSVGWPIAFECMVLYLRKIEELPDDFHLGNVIHQLGGLDTIRAEAMKVAETAYSTDIFRAHGGNPGTSINDPSGKVGDDKNKVYTGTIKGDNPNAATGCTAWNEGKPHLAKNVDARGYCKFAHKCCQFVSDRGKGGQCLGSVGDPSHKRKDCTYDAAKKLTRPCQQ